MNKPFVAICTPVYDSYESEFVRSMRQLQAPEPSIILDARGMLLDDARRKLSFVALGVPEVTHLFFVDADMGFKHDSLEKLLAMDKPIAAGLCFERRPPFNPTIKKDGRMMLDYPRDSVIECDSTGGAFILIKREVMDAIGHKFGGGTWWDTMVMDSVPVAGDESFIHRAKECGFGNPWINTAVKTSHTGKCLIDEEFFTKWRATP